MRHNETRGRPALGASMKNWLGKEDRKIVNFVAHRKRKVAAHFTRAELNQILGLYGEKARRGEWRHSSMEQRYGLVAYSVYQSPLERPLYTIAKFEHAHRDKGRYVLFQGKRRILQAKDLSEIMTDLRQSGTRH